MNRFFWICLGGAAGTGARYLVTLGSIAILGAGFSWGTLAINVIGSFFLSALLHVALATRLVGETARLALGVGVLGGFTTYSTFNAETLGYLRDGAWRLGVANVAATVILCLAAGVAGLAAARWIVGA
ncbi:MAG: CrcB family protein [Acidobacteriota bacterium]